jgi:hypothetical protein
LLEELGNRNWDIRLATTHVIQVVPSSSVVGSGGKFSGVKEFVFVGALTTLDGIKVFCEAIDIVASELVKAGISVSFTGVPDTIDNVPSEKWIDIYAGNWQDYGLEWQLVKVCFKLF